MARLPWDHPARTEKTDGYVRERSADPYHTARWTRLSRAFRADHPLCAECNRIRLTSDGKLKPCLHSSVEYPIKGLDREGMMEQFKTAIYGKPQWHGELNATERSKAGRNMNQIGG